MNSIQTWKFHPNAGCFTGISPTTSGRICIHPWFNDFQPWSPNAFLILSILSHSSSQVFPQVFPHGLQPSNAQAMPSNSTITGIGSDHGGRSARSRRGGRSNWLGTRCSCTAGRRAVPTRWIRCRSSWRPGGSMDGTCGYQMGTLGDTRWIQSPGICGEILGKRLYQSIRGQVNLHYEATRDSAVAAISPRALCVALSPDVSLGYSTMRSPRKTCSCLVR